jgi:hypothetical protein
MDGEIFVDILGHFTHGKAHVSIDFVPYLYRKAMIFCTDASKLIPIHCLELCSGESSRRAISNGSQLLQKI